MHIFNRAGRFLTKDPPASSSSGSPTSSISSRGPRIDGGIRAWSAAAGAWCCMFASYGFMNASGVFQDFYQAELLEGYSSWSISLVVSIQPFILFTAGLFVGRLFDNYGPRWILLAGTLLSGLGLAALSVSTQYWQILLSQGICNSLGASCLFHAALSSTATWFDKKKAFAFALVSSGSCIGGIVYPILLSSLLPSLGFAWTIRICMAIVVGAMLVANVLVRSAIAPRASRVGLRDYTAPLAEAPFVLLAVAAACGYLAMFVPTNYVILQARAGGVGASLVGMLVPTLNSSAIAARVLCLFADRLGRWNCMLVMVACGVLSIGAIWIPGTLAAPDRGAVYVAFMILYGFASGAFVALLPPLLGEISPDLNKIGTRQGVLYTCLAVASVSGSPIAGAIKDGQHGQFWGLQVFAGVMLLLSLLGFLACRMVVTGRASSSRRQRCRAAV